MKTIGITVPNGPPLGVPATGDLKIQGQASASAGSSGYDPGYPTAEPNVKAVYLFDESSGAIVDEVNSISLAVVGSPTFNVSASGLFAPLSPGITYSGTACHAKNTASAVLSVGASDHVVIEWYFSTAATGFGYYWSIRENLGTAFGIMFYQLNNTSLRLVMRNGSVGTTTYSWTTSTVSDSAIHKIRVVINRTTGLATLYLDGVSQGTQNISAFSGQAFSNLGLVMGGDYSSSQGFAMTMYNWRISIGTDVLSNNSGGPNGG